MKEEWLDFARACAMRPADFYSGARKIIRTRTITFENIKPDLLIGDCGFGKSKLTMLRKSYLHEESRNVAVELWDGRLDRAKYGSVGFHCYNHYVKGMGQASYWENHNNKKIAEHKRAKRASVMGPCIQAVNLTLLKKGETSIDIYYRTTEVFKKFPADLVFIRDELLAPFNFDTAPIQSIHFHFANVTVHPMYAVTMLPLLEDPVEFLASLKKRDEYFFNWVCKWTARYVCDEHMRGIQKFSQAMRTRKDALTRLKPDVLKSLQKYIRANHPGHRNDYEDPDADD